MGIRQGKIEDGPIEVFWKQQVNSKRNKMVAEMMLRLQSSSCRSCVPGNDDDTVIQSVVYADML